jgi:hypothetical protein
MFFLRKSSISIQKGLAGKFLTKRTSPNLIKGDYKIEFFYKQSSYENFSIRRCQEDVTVKKGAKVFSCPVLGIWKGYMQCKVIYQRGLLLISGRMFRHTMKKNFSYINLQLIPSQFPSFFSSVWMTVGYRQRKYGAAT